MPPKRITRKHAPWPERFWAKIDKSGPIPDGRADLGPCWIWTAYVDRSGYGRFCRFGKRAEYAHAIAYEVVIGLIPSGLEHDHLCKNRACPNPHHLDPVTHRINAMRGDGLYARNKRGDIVPKERKPDLQLSKKCRSGHDAWRHDRHGERYCAECLRLVRRGDVTTSAK